MGSTLELGTSSNKVKGNTAQNGARAEDARRCVLLFRTLFCMYLATGTVLKVQEDAVRLVVTQPTAKQLFWKVAGRGLWLLKMTQELN